ncbi:hypothetical protein [Flavobacterium psychrophilum]|uniref:hypothetical protein n=1 Tax=Flavobacterium psychrophilum TaxID=96345 RepID=UPI00073F1C32|nr:hypothetical protein [Flavobacterium psychrophilum]EKT4499743.1 hypothetical protein [Flavobacterium psychrophilum]EKT4501864.1 hypothetical protein [Flavobacterium psychrophilum]ELI6454663.1 hypothetical protein [Flavobacterium psychrophilum]ELM3651106.1 hypothetical protein [Flavobacterium psychrophilum]ELM3671574.1 hypothetical protein [Flavobacterium psychrophilum]
MENNIINKENFDNAKSFLNQVTELATKSNENLQLTNQKLQNTSDLLNKAGNIYLESKKIDNDNLKLKNELVTIVSDFKIKQGYLHAIFDERSRIIDKHFEVIDKGIRENNDELILKGLRGASEFVSTNPLDNFDNFKNILLDKNAPLELDF